MIISCYAGLGKTTVAKKRVDIVDLDSSLFRTIPTALEENEIDFDIYFNVAKSLSDQGYIVLVSSHDDIRKKLIDLVASGEPAGEIVPDWMLKDILIERLRIRWEATGREEDKRAYFRARMNFDDDLKLRREKPGGLCQIFLSGMPYDLEENIEWLIYAANHIEKHLRE